MKTQSKKELLKYVLPILILLTFCLIALGGMVRAMNAGLACPDWPLCFGKVIPQFDMQIFYEWFHRKIAALVGITTLVVSTLVFRNKKLPKEARVTMIVSLCILATQIILGGLTVLKLLNFGIVTAHLATGMAFLGSLLWLFFTTSDTSRARPQQPIPPGVLGALCFAGAVVFVQIILGGLVSSNYAGLACRDVPLCQGQLIPTLQGLVGLQVIHRLGAYITFFTMFALHRVLYAHRKEPWMSRQMVSIARLLITLVLIQAAVGMANVKFGIPAVITVLHLAMAATIFGFVLRIVFLGQHPLNRATT